MNTINLREADLYIQDTLISNEDEYADSEDYYLDDLPSSTPDVFELYEDR